MKPVILLLATTTLYGSVIGDIRYKLASGDLMNADAVMEEFCRDHRGTSECAAALSWLARGAEMVKDYADAQAYVDRTTTLTHELLKNTQVDSDPFLAMTVGASYEVQARLLADQGKRAQAIALLERELP